MPLLPAPSSSPTNTRTRGYEVVTSLRHACCPPPIASLFLAGSPPPDSPSLWPLVLPSPANCLGRSGVPDTGAGIRQDGPCGGGVELDAAHAAKWHAGVEQHHDRKEERGRSGQRMRGGVTSACGVPSLYVWIPVEAPLVCGADRRGSTARRTHEEEKVEPVRSTTSRLLPLHSASSGNDL
uniref:Uncharacterized protein P0406D01.109 n=1 Tax=Oryza sativa subsp. japonica TaxID=39947 RepID=Q69PQ5_ORYSJ|nr:hypothetical protein [Oryza sativa Japonica Group]